MNISNNFNLPEPIVQAVTNDPYKRVGHISVTSLIKSPRQLGLERRHHEEITEDASDRIWMLLGSSIHAILERAAISNSLTEERLLYSLHGWDISGQPDLLDHEHTLTDYKVTSTYAVQDGAKSDWVNQIQLYCCLYRHNGFEVKRGQIVCLFRDWSRARAGREPDYPQSPVLVIDIPLWSPEEQEVFLGERVRLHQQAEKLSDEELPFCMDEETWKRPDSWAVKKPGNKRATRVFDNSTAANAMGVATGYEVEFRAGVSVRCQSYCAAAPFCNQWARIKPATVTEDDVAA